MVSQFEINVFNRSTVEPKIFKLSFRSCWVSIVCLFSYSWNAITEEADSCQIGKLGRLKKRIIFVFKMEIFHLSLRFGAFISSSSSSQPSPSLGLRSVKFHYHLRWTCFLMPAGKRDLVCIGLWHHRRFARLLELHKPVGHTVPREMGVTEIQNKVERKKNANKYASRTQSRSKKWKKWTI